MPALSAPRAAPVRPGRVVLTRPVVAVVLALVAAGATGCRGPQLQPTEVSDRAVILTVPMVVQDELYECGLASISALCVYHGVRIPAAQRERLVRLAADERGISGGELREALEACGLEVFVFPGTLDHAVSGLYHHVDRGRPLLVMISVDEDSFHYCLFTGYDPEHDNVFLLDPRRGSLSLPAASFAALWAKCDSFTLLCSPPAADTADS